MEFIIELIDDICFEILYGIMCHNFDEMVDAGVDFTYYFVGTGEGILDAECVMEALFC